MPAKSEKQRKMMAIALHHPEKLHKENRGVLKMSKSDMREFASSRPRSHSPIKPVSRTVVPFNKVCK